MSGGVRRRRALRDSGRLDAAVSPVVDADRSPNEDAVRAANEDAAVPSDDDAAASSREAGNDLGAISRCSVSLPTVESTSGTLRASTASQPSNKSAPAAKSARSRVGVTTPPRGSPTRSSRRR
ncbi:hypothetical protein [Natronoarchaeum philippinense]|uniref:hypothetical protein n=1 Tax=Natronoarchaeum philippinense TaxID=558529 RepID=UPI000BE39C73|nr:hypothetical protein [Natronoarchaeum philippinense]